MTDNDRFSTLARRAGTACGLISRTARSPFRWAKKLPRLPSLPFAAKQKQDALIEQLRESILADLDQKQAGAEERLRHMMETLATLREQIEIISRYRADNDAQISLSSRSHRETDPLNPEESSILTGIYRENLALRNERDG